MLGKSDSDTCRTYGQLDSRVDIGGERCHYRAVLEAVKAQSGGFALDSRPVLFTVDARRFVLTRTDLPKSAAGNLGRAS